MFIGFFQHLRQRGLKVSLQEWLDLMQALGMGLANESLAGFYELSRALLVKSETRFDLFDQCFAEYFRGVAVPPAVHDDLWKWLQQAPLPRSLSADELAKLKSLSLEELQKQFAERLAEQKEQHDGGNKWIGTGGTSPFGHSGRHPSGLRVGGESRSRSAVQVAEERRYYDLNAQLTLDTRQFSLALKSLRDLARNTGRDELDLKATIATTAKNAGDLVLEWRPSRKNTVKLLLLMDVGGSMTVHTQLCEQLFSAAHSLNHFKEFRCLFFHNCPYDELYESGGERRQLATMDILSQVDSSWYLLIVGDAMMNPYELTAADGRIDFYRQNAEPGLVWLQRLRQHLPRSAWLNPEPINTWQMPSVRLVRQVFTRMFPLSVDGLQDCITALKRTAQP